MKGNKSDLWDQSDLTMIHQVTVESTRLSEGQSWPRSGLDCRGRSKGLGQGMADRTPCRGGQGQMLDGPTLGSDPVQT